MSNSDLTSLSISEAKNQMDRGHLSPLELTHAHIERIDKLDGMLNSYITVTSEIALERAKQADQELVRGSRSNGKPLGRLHGIPIALKDLYDTKGILTTAGSKIFAERVPKTDAHVVERLHQAGMVLLGKLNMHEIALGLTNVNPHAGTCRNPWSTDRITGGSSGGSGAALAAELCMGSLGSDTGGSIRVPAALCGVVGLKPTYGRVSLRGIVPLSWNLDHAGPMARNVLDVAILFEEIVGYDDQDPFSIDTPDEKFYQSIREGVQGLKVALADDKYFERTNPEIKQAIQIAANQFEKLGADVVHTALPGAREAAQANGLMVVSDAATFHRERLEKQPDDFGEDILQRLQIGLELNSRDYILARRTQTLMRRQFEQFFEHYDILLMPTTSVTAPLIDGPDALEQAPRLTRYTAAFNITGLPAISLPCGFSSENLPIGLQIVSKPWGEARVLQAAYAYEQATEWHLRKPPL